MSNLMTALDNTNGEILPIIDACRRWPCSQCGYNRACVIRVTERLICVNCRFDEVGKSALYEALYNGID